LTLVLFGAGIARTGIVAKWLGWIAMLGGLGLEPALRPLAYHADHR
jgi:hypothetical protein